MVFSSIIFLFCFLPLVLVGYYLLPLHSLRNAWLLLLSLTFYAWGEPLLITVMVVSMLINFTMGLTIERLRLGCWAKTILVLGIVGNLSLLGYYKYVGFIIENYNFLADWFGLPRFKPTSVLLPLGISFYTFQGISYLVDVYRRDVRATRNPLHLMLYISLFPHQLAGPIVRFRDIANQLASRRVTAENFRTGAMRFTRGLAKKVLLANVVAATADAIFAQPVSELIWSVAWLGVICYTLQIYLDFSAYSDMAIGLAGLFGITFAENFNYPYAAQSVTDFWRRWHMTLSQWFRDYVYIPLGGNRRGPIRTYFNLCVVFLLCGLWHGASWTFIVWGAYHGLFLALERAGLGRLIEERSRFIRHFYTLLAVMVGWVFFRSDSSAQAQAFLGAMFGLGAFSSVVYPLTIYIDPMLITVMVVSIAVSLPLTGIAIRGSVAVESAVWLRIALAGMGRMAAVCSLIIVCGVRIVGGSHNPFIYFRF